MSRLATLAACVALAACAHGRTADAYRTDTQRVLDTKNDEIKTCYDKVLAGSATAAGKVTVKFAVAEKSGQIVEPKVDPSQTTAPDGVSQCVLAALPTLALVPADKNRGEVTWSWDFKAPAATP